MKAIQYIAYRCLTPSDYFNIYKMPGTEIGGGGQLYIDFPTASITIREWTDFFQGVTGLKETQGLHGPRWRFPVHSIGLPGRKDTLTMYQRRPQTVCVANQNLYTSGADRISAWDPQSGFPGPSGPLKRGENPPANLTIFLARTTDGQVWAGWVQRGVAESLCETIGSAELLRGMINIHNLPGRADMLKFAPNTLFIREDSTTPVFTTLGLAIENEPVLDNWFNEEDESSSLRGQKKQEHFRRVRDRNKRAVQDLKRLYDYRCQLTGDEFAFQTRDGSRYVEAHHLLPLGEGGADHPFNITVVSAHIHRMLHYANVSKPNFRNLREDRKEWGILPITINGTNYEIRWHPRHYEIVCRYQRRE